MTWWQRELRSALRAGVARDRYWTLTASELWEELDAWRWRERREAARTVTTAWLSAAYARIPPNRRLPKLADELRPILDPPRPVTTEDRERTLARQANAWNTIFRQLGEQQEKARAEAGR